MKIIDRFKNAWNLFFNKDPTKDTEYLGPSYGYRQDRAVIQNNGGERTILASIINRIAVDCADVNVRHVLVDEEGRYQDEVNSSLNRCFKVEANIDQTGRAFVQDIVTSMLDEGTVAIVPIDTDAPIDKTLNFEINSMRTGKIIEWYPRHVKVRVYDDHEGKKKDIRLPKESVAIVENPFYDVFNAPNSTFKRLMRKLAILDTVDEQSGSSKLNMLIQLPYAVKTDIQKQQAADRKKMIEDQLMNDKYGIAYIDSTEHITQLNRPLENNLLNTVEYLTSMLYSQLGMTPEIMNGTAKEETMTNYDTRVCAVILTAITEECYRKFLTVESQEDGHSIMFFKDPFKIMPISKIADIADKFTRNEIMTSNEFRQKIGMKPSDDPEADSLRNKNISMPADYYEEEAAMAPQENTEEGV